ncbi:MAG: phosphoribosylanthranilate isomerase [Aquificae bacterium]|nr:phosphoribosylanthranilate isomerase [Aquificota bacterium]
MIIKICGITKEEQAKKIAEFGATHIGVIHFPKSPRHINLEKIKKIKNALPKNTKLVAVVVNPEKETVKNLLKIVDIIQFHGDEPIEFLKLFPKEKVFKAFRVKNLSDMEKIKPFVEEGFTILIDAFDKKAYGGTGKQINPEVAKNIVKTFKKVILSGGLSPDNVESLIKEINPFGVDVSSKIEIKPGIKDLEKAKEFIKKAKKAFGENN